MPRQLNILALEPYFGGVRKDTLELLARHSRHRWTVFKLPARRLERRLNTAAQWFTQQLARTPGLKCDAIFTSDALNLADFLRLNPSLGHKPGVSYFYCNLLAGDLSENQQAKLSLLSTAASATEIWFSTVHHLKGLLNSAAMIYAGHPELGGREPVRGLVAKSQVLHPPVEITSPGQNADVVDSERRSRTLCIDAREGDLGIFRSIFQEIASRSEAASIHVIGPTIPDVPARISVTQVDAKDDAQIVQSLRKCEIFISLPTDEIFDPLAMRAMALGCIPILPRDGFSSEFVPMSLRRSCLFDRTADDLMSRLTDLWYLRRPAVARKDLDVIFTRYSPIAATRLFDERLEHLVDEFGG